MAYGKIKADTLVYDDSGSDVEKTIASLAAAAPTASPTFTGDVTLTGASANVVFDASDNALEFADSAKLTFGAAADLSITHNGTDTLYENTTGNVYFRNDGNNTYFQMGTSNEASLTLSKDGPVILSYDGSTRVTTTTAGVTITGAVTDDKGNLRSIPQNTQGSTYTLVAADAGKHILASGTITVPNSIFSAGDAVTIVNNTSGDLTITKTITTMYLGTDATSANRTLATRGVATILFASGTVAYISGAGLS